MSLQVPRICLDLHEDMLLAVRLPLFFLQSHIFLPIAMEFLQFLHLALEAKLFWTLLKLFHLAFMGPKEIFLVLLVFVKDVCQAPQA